MTGLLLALLALLALLVACEGKGGDDDYGTGPQVFSEPTVHIGDSWLFSSTRINRISLTIDFEGMRILRSERRFSYPRNKVRAAAFIDDEDVGDVGVRLRGGLGSFARIDGKPKLEIDFNEFSGERFYGLESLSLNSMIFGCDGTREALAFASYDLAGLATSRTGYAQVFVNGQDYGMYLVLETQDDRWLRRNFVDGSGNFYDGKYVFTGFWLRTIDFDVGRDDWFDLEEGTDVGFTDIARISGGVKRARVLGRIDPSFWPLVDWEQLVTLLRVEQWTGNHDSYGTGSNNYRVYFEPGRPLVMSPWDTDGAFPSAWIEGEDPDASRNVSFDPDGWEYPSGALAQVCLDDPTCRQLWDEQGSWVQERLSDGTLYDLALDLAVLTEEGMTGDPRRECRAKDVLGDQDAILDYLEQGELPRGKDGGGGKDCSHLDQRGGLWLSLGLLGLLGLRRRPLT